MIFLDFSVNFGQSQPGPKGARLLVSNIDQQACNSNDPMMLLLCVRLVRKATLKVPKDKTGATQNISNIDQQDYDLAGFHGSRREKKGSLNWWRSRLSSPKSVNLNGETVKLATQKGEFCSNSFFLYPEIPLLFREHTWLVFGDE